MGKLNYANRKSEGLKLGQIVAKDLRKRTITHSPKASEPFLLEINLHGKSLTDEGFVEVALALQEILIIQPSGSSRSELDDLNLSENGLTWKSLPYLAQVVRLAAPSLRELNLSGNKIQVRENAESEAWEEFLDSFRGCHSLSKLDLSGNVLAGPRPFEILARVFVKHARLDDVGDAACAAYENHSVLSASMLETRQNERTGLRDLRVGETLDSPSLSAVEKDKCDDHDMDDANMRCTGLRSIPSIIFSDCSMSYAGALFLSSAFFQYRPLKHLKTHRRRSSSAINPTVVQPDYSYAEHRGLVYLPNPNLPSIGRSILESALIISREQSQHEYGLSYEHSAQKENILQNTDHIHFPSYSGIRKFRRSTLSTAIENSEDLPEFRASARIRLESFHKKAERSTIEDLGPNSVQLWSSALKMLRCVRSLCTFDSDRIINPKKAEHGSLTLSGTTLINREYDDDAIIESLSTSRPPPKMMHPALRKSPTISLARNGPPATAAFTLDFSKRQTIKPAVTSHSLLPPSLHSHPCRSQNDSNVTIITANSVTTSTTAGSSTVPTTIDSQNYHHQQQKRHHHASKQDGLYPWQTLLPSRGQNHLPQHIWRRIVALAIGGPEDTLSERQMNKIFAWAVDRGTLDIERDRLGKSESAQIWMVLDVMGCLSYEI